MQFFRRIRQLLADRSILTKVIITLFVIVTPLYAFNYMINNIGADKNRTEISNALQNSIHSYNNILENEFIRLQQMLHNSALQIAVAQVNVTNPDTPYQEKSIFFTLVQGYLNQIQYSSRFITSTRAYFPFLETTLSIANENSSGFNKLEYEALSQKSDSFIMSQDKMYMSVPYITNHNDQSGLFILAVEMSRENISSYLSNIMSFERGGAILFDHQQTWEITNRSDDQITADIKQYLSKINDFNKLDEGPIIESVDFKGEPYLIVFENSSKLETILVAFAPESEIYGSLKVYHDFFYFMSVLSILIIVICSLWLYKLIHKPLRNLVNAFHKIEIGNLDFSLQHNNKDEFGYLYRRFNDMVGKLNTLVHVVYEQKILNQRSELKRLQSQINPHFLYNNFFVLQRLIHLRQNEKASKFASYLGQYFQFVTRDAADEIPLAEDIRHAKTYMEIQSVCFDQRISYMIETLPQEIEHILVPRLILQPILENSFKHAFENQLSEGRLIVKFKLDDRFIRIITEDNGKQMGDDQLSELRQQLKLSDSYMDESTGIINVHRRIRLKFGNQSGLNLSRSTLGGMRTEIIIDREEVNDYA